jgi:hypothetical protein
MVQVSDGVELIRQSHRRDDPGRFRVDRACHCAQPKLLIVRVRGVKGEQVGIRRDGTSVGDGASWCFWGDAFLALDHLRPGPRVAPKVTRVVSPAARRGIGFVEGNWPLHRGASLDRQGGRERASPCPLASSESHQSNGSQPHRAAFLLLHP